MPSKLDPASGYWLNRVIGPSARLFRLRWERRNFGKGQDIFGLDLLLIGGVLAMGALVVVVMGVAMLCLFGVAGGLHHIVRRRPSQRRRPLPAGTGPGAEDTSPPPVQACPTLPEQAAPVRPATSRARAARTAAAMPAALAVPGPASVPRQPRPAAQALMAPAEPVRRPTPHPLAPARAAAEGAKRVLHHAGPGRKKRTRR